MTLGVSSGVWALLPGSGPVVASRVPPPLVTVQDWKLTGPQVCVQAAGCTVEWFCSPPGQTAITEAGGEALLPEPVRPQQPAFLKSRARGLLPRPGPGSLRWDRDSCWVAPLLSASLESRPSPPPPSFVSCLNSAVLPCSLLSWSQLLHTICTVSLDIWSPRPPLLAALIAPPNLMSCCRILTRLCLLTQPHCLPSYRLLKASFCCCGLVPTDITP